VLAELVREQGQLLALPHAVSQPTFLSAALRT
jgi:hypothetical protein